MTFQVLQISSTTIFVVSITLILVLRYFRSSRAFGRVGGQRLPKDLPENIVQLTKSLTSALPNSTVIAENKSIFDTLKNCHWARQECEVVPACIVRPRDVQQLCTAITVLGREYTTRPKQALGQSPEGLFAVRSGGHSPIPSAANIEGGVVIDLSLLSEVTPSDDGTSVVIGAGAKWIHVSKVLDEKGLAVIGGRSSAVGVGGLALGGGLSFFSSRFGLVCSNVISYSVVLASGSVVTASSSQNSDLWRALKGGSNNFGVVASMTVRSFPCTNIWGGFLYLPSSQAIKVLAAFHGFVARADASNPGLKYDEFAAGPMACFTYIQKLGIQAISVNLVSTQPPESQEKWPPCWKTSGFKSLWWFWNTCKTRSLTSMTDEMCALNPPGKRQVFATTTVQNDTSTLAVAHSAYYNAISSIRHVKGMIWTLVLQPFLPIWARKGFGNPLGLDEGTPEPLVIVSFTINWTDQKDDECVKATTRQAIEQIDDFATINKTGHRYRYLNYCGEWQDPFKGYGEENLRFLQATSRKYDPEGLFQKGCTGGFKLGMPDKGSGALQ